MKKILAIVFLVVVLFGIWKIFGNRTDGNSVTDKLEPIRTLAHSGVFNQSLSNVVNSYLDLTSSFVNDDSINVKVRVTKFIGCLDSLKLEELQKDSNSNYTTVKAQASDIKTNAQAILQETQLTEMRKDYKMVSENLFPFLKTMGYKGQKLYFDNCPMAFGEDKDGSWISNSKEIVNPYMGKHHPEYKSAMIHCGEINDTIK